MPQELHAFMSFVAQLLGGRGLGHRRHWITNPTQEERNLLLNKIEVKDRCCCGVVIDRWFELSCTCVM